MERMARSGCRGLNLGIESIHSDALESVGRKTFSLERARQLVKKCRAVDIEMYCLFIIGLPGDTKETVLGTLEFAHELDPTIAQCTAATPYFGTRLRSWAIEKGFLEDKREERLTGWEVVMRNDHLTAHQIRLLLRYAGFSWNLRKKRVRERLHGKGPLLHLKEVVKFLLFMLLKARIKWMR